MGTIDLGQVVGPQGPQGIQGQQGIQGIQGPQGAAATINGKNALTLNAEDPVTAVQDGDILTLRFQTNKLQKVSQVLGTDSILTETARAGTARVPFGVAAEFMADFFRCGGVPYGKELTESWPAILARIKAGDISGLHIGDYKTIQLTTGEVVIPEVSGICQYYRYGDQEIGYHVDFISRDCLLNSPAGKYKFNDTATNNGTAAEPSPWRASKLFRTLNEDVWATLPADLKSCIIPKRAMLESRYSEAGTLSESTGSVWADMGKLWLPMELEVFGNAIWSDERWGSMGFRQYPIFIGNSLHHIKGNGNGGDRIIWVEASADRTDSKRVCTVHADGSANSANAMHTAVSVPLCFRIG